MRILSSSRFWICRNWCGGCEGRRRPFRIYLVIARRALARRGNPWRVHALHGDGLLRRFAPRNDERKCFRINLVIARRALARRGNPWRVHALHRDGLLRRFAPRNDERKCFRISLVIARRALALRGNPWRVHALHRDGLVRRFAPRNDELKYWQNKPRHCDEAAGPMRQSIATTRRRHPSGSSRTLSRQRPRMSCNARMSLSGNWPSVRAIIWRWMLSPRAKASRPASVM